MSKEPSRIYGTGKIGAMVVLDHVGLSRGNPFYEYPQPAFFTIDAVGPGANPGDYPAYILRDTAGKRIMTDGSIAGYLYQVDEWSAWRQSQFEETVASQDRALSTLRDRLTLLKDILTAQGVRVVPNDQAEKLGLK